MSDHIQHEAEAPGYNYGELSRLSQARKTTVDYSRYQTLKVEKQDRIAIMTWNRPAALNSINHQMHLELEDIWLDLQQDDEVYAVVTTGAGRVYSAGGDLKDQRASLVNNTFYVNHYMARRLILNLLTLDKPLIAAMNGDAIGLAANLILYHDIIIASDDAHLGDPHVRVGLVAGDSGCIVWPMAAGPAKAKELLLTGDLIGAKQAESLGIINYAVPRDQVMPRAMEFARRLAYGPTRAIRWTKVCYNKRLKDEVNMVLDASLGLEFAETFGRHDHLEAVSAFYEKREPHYTGE